MLVSVGAELLDTESRAGPPKVTDMVALEVWRTALDRQATEGGHAVYCVHWRGAAERTTARISLNRHPDRGGTVSKVTVGVWI